MSKTSMTKKLERSIWKATNKTGVFGCFEVTIGFRGNERVDYLTYDTKGIWRCYEIKTSKEDFHSKAAKTFIGHYNYFVMPEDLYEEVKKDIPKYVGVHNGCRCIKNAKRQELGVDEQVLKDSMIRSLYREYEKFIRSDDAKYVGKLNKEINRLKRDSEFHRRENIRYKNAIYYICEEFDLDYKEVRAFVRDFI